MGTVTEVILVTMPIWGTILILVVTKAIDKMSKSRDLELNDW